MPKGMRHEVVTEIFTLATLYESQHEKMYLLICAQRRLNSVCASAQSHHNLRCPHEETIALVIQNAPSEDSDQTARMRRLIRIFTGRTCPKVRFLTLRLICIPRGAV